MARLIVRYSRRLAVLERSPWRHAPIHVLALRINTEIVRLEGQRARAHKQLRTLPLPLRLYALGVIAYERYRFDQRVKGMNHDKDNAALHRDRRPARRAWWVSVASKEAGPTVRDVHRRAAANDE